MSLTKYASLEHAQVLELRSSPVKARHASLSRLADFHQYRTDDGFLYARIRAISSRVNKNHDGWPSIELAGGADLIDRHVSSADGFTVVADSDRRFGFSTFLGKPIFIDHHNSDPGRARGVIVDASLHVEDHKTSALDPYYSSPHVDPEHLPGTWVELLLEVDAKSFPKFAKAIVEGSRNPKKGIDGWSMGCDVTHSLCSICKNSATAPEEYCKHIKMKGAYFDWTDPKSGQKVSKKAYENCYGVSFFEISGVFDPADETALSREVRSKTAGDGPSGEVLFPPCPSCQQVAGFRPYPFARDTLECKNPGCKHLIGARALGDLYNQMKLTDAADLASLPETDHPLGHEGKSQTDTIIQNPKEKSLKDAADEQAEEYLDDTEAGKQRRKKTGAVRLADNPPPQSEQSHAPEHVDTLREEEICPVCGSSMDEDTCDVCGYQEPPDGFGNPDLTKAQDVDVPTAPQDDSRIDAPGVDQNEAPQAGPQPPQATNVPNNPALVAHVTSDMEWDVHSRTAARINQVEQPLVSSEKPKTNEPKEKILSDQLKPVTSRVRTAQDFIAAAGATRRNTEMNHTADAASGAPAVAKPDVHTDVTGVGGVDQASNDAASKADAQVDVTAVGGTGVESVAAEQEGTNVEQGDEHSKNIEAIPTKTWSDGQGDSLGQHNPVTSEPFPASADGVRAVSHWVVEGHDDGPFPPDADIGGGTAVKGVQPIAEDFGDRVNVLEHVTSPSNNSGPTKTWTGTEGNGVNKQQDPVTPESIARGESEMEGAPNWTSSTHIFAAFKLADLEVDLGLIPADKKYERAAELERQTPTVVEASLKYAQRVRQASARKTAGVAKLPVMGRSSAPKEAAAVAPATEDDSFMFGGV